MPITADQKEFFAQNGWLHLPRFYDVEKEIVPIHQGVWDISLAVAKRHSVSLPDIKFGLETFDQPYYHLRDLNRTYASEVYDLIKLIPAFIRLVGSEKNEQLFNSLRPDASVGVNRSSFGIRVDNPGEHEYSAPWHQDYLGPFGSPDGMVLWSGLCPVKHEMGPVKILRGSHKDGFRRVTLKDKNYIPKEGDYQKKANNYQIENEDLLEQQYKVDSLETGFGDLLVMDYLTIHKSGRNVGTRARWTMQHRLFNFHNEEGRRIGWYGGYPSGASMEEIYPEYFIREAS
jgi:hypothetical protein